MSGIDLTRRAFLGRAAVVVTGVIVTPAVLEACAAPTQTTAPASAGASAAPGTAAASASAAATAAASVPAASATAAATAAATTAPTTAGEISDFGKALPADAAPKQFQVIQGSASSTGKGWNAMNALESVYSSGPGFANVEEHLVRVDKDWQVKPAGATKWEVAADGVTWTFTLNPDLVWSNGEPTTAEDYVATFRYAADPKHAWDFVWYYDGVIKNFGEASRGEASVNDIGVAVGADKFSLIITTARPVPYLPAMLIWSAALHAKSLAKFGSGVYNTNPKDAITNGAYLLEEFSPEKQIIFGANPLYKSSIQPLIDQQVFKIVTGGSDFQRYLAGEIDSVGPTAGDMPQILADPALKAQLKMTAGDFRTFYVFFDTTKDPWKDKRVRLAFAKAIDRQGIADGVLAPLGLPAWSWLEPGFPDANEEELKPIQAYNPDEAKQLLADAGFPNGDGFPAQTLIVRGGAPETIAALTQAVAASITQVLGVKIDLQTLDLPIFSEKVSKREIAFGYVSYGMDFLDATNMLGLWKSNGRHNWNNAEFDKLVLEGGSITNDPAARSKAMKDAERLLLEDAPVIPIAHPLYGQLQKPYRKGAWQEPNKAGFTGSQWPGETPQSEFLDTLYHGKEIETMRKA